MARKRKKDAKQKNAMLPVMRPDAAGIDIGATEIFVAVPADRAADRRRHPDGCRWRRRGATLGR